MPRKGSSDGCQCKTLRHPEMLALVVAALIAGGCSSLLPNKQDRDTNLAAYLYRPERLVLYEQASLHSEEKLQALGVENSGERFTRQFQVPDPMLGVIEQFLAATPSLSDGSVRVVPPAEARSLNVGWDEPVLFFHSDWQMVYRRLPPSFAMNLVQAGVIAKIIPLGQVLSGKGSIALRTASWEGGCFFKAFGGEFFHLDEWAARDGARLHQGIAEIEASCASKLSSEFTAALFSSSRGSP